MKRQVPLRLLLALSIPAMLAARVALVALSGWLYTVLQLHKAALEGVYPSARDGMVGLIERNYRDIQRIEVEHAGTNSFDGSHPHTWFVIARVWAGSRLDGGSVGSHGRDYDYPGSFFLHTKQGWVHVPEGAFPELVGLWMQLYGLTGW